MRPQELDAVKDRRRDALAALAPKLAEALKKGRTPYLDFSREEWGATVDMILAEFDRIQGGE